MESVRKAIRLLSPKPGDVLVIDASLPINDICHDGTGLGLDFPLGVLAVDDVNALRLVSFAQVQSALHDWDPDWRISITKASDGKWTGTLSRIHYKMEISDPHLTEVIRIMDSAISRIEAGHAI